jgi:hypothetical protein
MLTFDTLYDDALDYRKAFPSAHGVKLHTFLWDYVRNDDWGFRIINSLISRDTLQGTLHTIGWYGELGCFGYIVACIVCFPTVGVRNLTVMRKID